MIEHTRLIIILNKELVTLSNGQDVCVQIVIWMMTSYLLVQKKQKNLEWFLCAVPDSVMFMECGSSGLDELTHLPLDKVAAIWQTTLSNAFFKMKITEFRLEFHWSLLPGVRLAIPALVQVMIIADSVERGTVGPYWDTQQNRATVHVFNLIHCKETWGHPTKRVTLHVFILIHC